MSLSELCLLIFCAVVLLRVLAVVEETRDMLDKVRKHLAVLPDVGETSADKR